MTCPDKNHPLWPGLMAFLFFALTGSRTIQWQDHGQFVLRIDTGTLYNDWGLAMTHPLHFWTGRLFVNLLPVPAPQAVALVSALGGAVAVALVYAAIRLVTTNTRAAVFGACALALAHTFWRYSGIQEEKTLSAALLMLQVYFLLRLRLSGDARWWIPLLGANGLHWANHNMALLELAVIGPAFFYAWLGQKGLTCKQALSALGLWTLGASPYWLLIVRAWIEGQGFWPVAQSALFGYGFKSQVMTFLPTWLYTAATLAFTALSFAGLTLPLAGYGLWKTRREFPLLPAILLMHLVFILRYDVIDQYHFMVPSFALLALFAGIGFHHCGTRSLKTAAVAFLCAQPLLYAALPGIVRAAGGLGSYERAKPYRDDAEYLFHPWMFRETSAARISTDAVDSAAPEGAIVVEDGMGVYAVEWTLYNRGHNRVEVLRPDDTEAINQAESTAPPLIWMPARTDTLPQPGWQPIPGRKVWHWTGSDGRKRSD